MSAAAGVRAWRGIPFAAPPVGDLRWRPPADPEPWDGVRQAQDYGPPCLQGTSSSLGSGLIDIEGGSEDCLTLNVSRPDDDREDLPVMVWIHGGSFLHGSGSQPIYNSPALVDRGVVLVTVNYRLGRLGFFAHPALSDEPGPEVANFGLLDQVKALEWVRDNIEGFGGDPDERDGLRGVRRRRVGERADGQPGRGGLFAKAITQSGLGREPPRASTPPGPRGERLVAGLGLDEPTPTALRDVPATKVMGLPLNLLTGRRPDRRRHGAARAGGRRSSRRATRRRCRTWSAPRTSRCPTSSCSRPAGTRRACARRSSGTTSALRWRRTAAGRRSTGT